MANPLLVIEFEWREVPTTCEPCTGCGDIIYGKQYQLFCEPGGPIESILCQSCKMEVDG
jgi:hypothetical protein